MTITFTEEPDEWVKAYSDRLNDSQEYADAADGWGVDFDGSFLFEVRPDDAYPGEPVYLFLELEDGRCLEASAIADPASTTYGFALRADYSDWKELIRGNLNPIEAILSGPFDLDGDRVKVMQYSGAGVAMTDLAATVDTEFRY